MHATCDTCGVTPTEVRDQTCHLCWPLDITVTFSGHTSGKATKLPESVDEVGAANLLAFGTLSQVDVITWSATGAIAWVTTYKRT